MGIKKSLTEQLAWDLMECHTEFCHLQNGDIYTDYGFTAHRLVTERNWAKKDPNTIPTEEVISRIQDIFDQLSESKNRLLKEMLDPTDCLDGRPFATQQGTILGLEIANDLLRDWFLELTDTDTSEDE